MDPGARKAQLSPEQRARVEARLRQNASAGTPRIPLRELGQAVPLSFAQERMWKWERIPITSPLHNAPSALRLRGELDIPRLEWSLNQIVRRHEPLRFVFEGDAGTPLQRPLHHMTIPIVIREIHGANEEERAAKTRESAAEEARTPFDLSRGPLLRAAVLRFAPDDHALLLTLHHLVFDGWSKGVLIRELLAFYRGARDSTLPELPIQFGDFAVWQRSTRGVDEGTSDIGYWKGQLANASTWDFPFQRARPERQTFDGHRRWIRLSPELSVQVRAAAEREGATTFMALLAAWAAHCARVTGQQDLVIGSLVAGRTVPETELLIGFFVNYLPLRIDCSGGPSFRALLGRVRRVCLDGYEHQDAPFQTLVEQLATGGDPSRHPVFSTTFTLHNGPMPAIQVPGLHVELIEFDDRLIRLDLEFDLWWSGDRLEGFIVHNTALFDDADIRALTAGYEDLLGRFTRDPESPAIAEPGSAFSVV